MSRTEPPPQVLVTGARGLLGRALVPALEATGHQVWTTSRAAAEPTSQVIAADLTGADACNDLVRRTRPDIVVHLAGGPNGSGPELYAANVVATVNLLQAFASGAPGRRVIVVGSAAEYGEQGSPVHASAATQPVTEYGRAKLAQTMVARSIAQREGLDLCVLRPFNVVAPGLPASTALGNLRRQLLDQAGGKTPGALSVTCGRTDIIRDYVSRSTVVETLCTVCDLEHWPDVLNVCSGIGHSLDEIIVEMGLVLSQRIEIERDPALVNLPAPAALVGDAGPLRALGIDPSVSAASIARESLA